MAARATAPVEAARGGAREFALDTLVVGATQLLLKLRALATLPLIVKLLGTAEYGVWVQVLAFATLLGPLLSGNLHLPLVTLFVQEPERRRDAYTTLALATAAAALVGGAAALLAGDQIAWLLLGDASRAAELRVAGLLVLGANLRLLNFSVYRAVGRFRLRSALELFGGFGELAGILLLLSRGAGILEVLTFMAAFQGALVAAQCVHVLRLTGRGRFDRSLLLRALRYGLPVLPTAVTVFLLDRADRFVIGHLLGAAAVGVYSAQYALAGLLMLFQAPFQATLFPRVAGLWTQDRPRAVRYVSASCRLFLTAAIPFCFAVAVVAPGFLTLVANAEIARGSGPTSALLAFGILLWGVAVMQSQFFYAARRTGRLGAATGAGVAVNLALNLALVPVLGIAGAVAATVAAYAVVCLLLARGIRDVASLGLDARHLARCVAAALVMAAALTLVPGEGALRLAAQAALGAAVYLAALRLLGGLSADEVRRARQLLARRPAAAPAAPRTVPA